MCFERFNNNRFFLLRSSGTGTSSSANTLNRKVTIRKSQRYSMSVVQDKHRKDDIPM